MAQKGFSEKHIDSLRCMVICFNDEKFKGVSLKQVCLAYLDEILNGNLLDFMDAGHNEIIKWNYSGLMFVLNSLKGISISELGWKNYCQVMNELLSIHCESLFNAKKTKTPGQKTYHKVPKEITYTITRDDGCIMIANTEIRLCVRAVTKARNVLNSLYLYILDNYMLGLENLIELDRFRHLLISEERTVIRLKPVNLEALRGKVFTNFPIDSNCAEVYLFGYVNTGRKIQSIINFNSSHPLIHELLIGFIESFENSSLYWLSASYPYRQFFYYFRDSLSFFNDDELKSVKDFTHKVFNKQYRFYKRINYQAVTLQNDTASENVFTNLLIRFYCYLFEYIEKNGIKHNIFEGTNIKKADLASNMFRSNYEKGYRYLIHRQMEDTPIAYNRWALKRDKNTASSSSHAHVFCDFTGFKDKSFIRGLEEQQRTFVEDCKRYIWKGKSAKHKPHNRIFAIKDFLNFKYDYDNRRNKVVNINRAKEKLFPIEFMMSYIVHLYNKYEDQGTRYIRARYIKDFLRHYKKNYEVDEIIFNRLALPEKDDDGGNPISEADLDLITAEFQKRKDDSVRDELFWIIFKLKKTTKLRIGEILNLKRDCIYDEDFFEIQHYSKVSYGELAYTNLTDEKIADIKRAIEITKEFADLADEDTKEYIFINKAKNAKGKVNRLNGQFTSRFREIVRSLVASLSVTTYVAYNLRDTFIDAIYKEGIKEGLSIVQIADYAGNSYYTANKSYRLREELIEYAEAFAGVIISDVDIHGNILETEEEIEELDVVQDGAGGCSEKEGCIRVLEGIEDKYICLKCPSFITCISRLPVFKKNIEQLKSQLEEASDEDEINFINAQLKLNGAFYAELLNKKEAGKNA